MSNGDDETIASDGGDETQAAGGDATQFGGGPPADVEEPGNDRKPWLIGLAILVAGLIVGAGVAVAGSGGGDNDASSTSTSSSTSTTSTTATPSGGGGGGSGNATTTTTTDPGDDPKIDSFSASPGTITCVHPTDSKSVSLSWSTTNTTQVVLSVDGPGEYASYAGGPGNQAVGIACPPYGTNAQHTYTITAKGPNGPDATKTITYSINTIPMM